jgi:recombination protein RecA
MARSRKTPSDTVKSGITAEDKLKALKRATDEINEEFGDMSAYLLGSNPKVEVHRTSTGSLALDYVLGGGVADGRIHEFFGPEGSGKTSAALQTIGNAQKNGGVAAFVDVEHALDPRQAHRLGVDIDKLMFSQPDNAEQALNIVEILVQSGAVDVIVLDSIASLVPKAVMEGNAEDQTIGLVARLMSKELAKIATLASNSGTAAIFINQVRDAIGGYGNPETTPGGRALKFYSSIRVRISKGKQINRKVNGEDRPVGQDVYFRCKKNKVSTPFLTSESKFFWKRGYDTATDIATFGKKYGVFNSTGSKDLTSSPDGEQILWKGDKVTKTDMLISALQDKKSGLLDKYYPIVLQKMEEAQDFDDEDDLEEDEDTETGSTVDDLDPNLETEPTE